MKVQRRRQIHTSIIDGSLSIDTCRAWRIQKMTYDWSVCLRWKYHNMRKRQKKVCNKIWTAIQDQNKKVNERISMIKEK